MLNDELIGAYLDGELDAERRALVEHWLKSDKGAAARLERMREADALVRGALPRLARRDDDPLAAAILSPAEKPVFLRRPLVAQVLAMAACAIVGIGIGRFAQVGAPTPAFAPLAMSSDVSRLLNTMPSGGMTAFDGGAFAVQLSLRSEAGDLCRQFNFSRDGQGSEALACRNGAEWRVVAAAESAPEAEGYVPASGASVLDAAIERLGAVEALDETQERALIESGWAISPR